MAKRELIDREKAENITWEEPSYTDALNVLTEVRDKIRELPVIAEQDIVKPYLEKLKEQIVGKSYTDEFLDEDAFNSMYSESVSKDTAEFESYIEMTIVKMDDVLRLIDNLLSESGGEE